MDDPGLGPSEHLRALKALALVNRLSLAAGRIWREVLRQGEASRGTGGRSRIGAGSGADGGGAQEGGGIPEGCGAVGSGPRRLRLLDVACGGGDIARALARRAQRENFPLEVHGCDVSPVALAHAREQALREGLEVSFFELDALRAPFPPGFDIVCSSLFLHHLSERECVRVLAGMAEAGKTLILQDLLRSRTGYWLAWGTLRLLSRSRVAQVDGPRSVRASFRIPEVAALARKAGLEGARIVPCWPQRFTLYWRKR